MVILMRWANDPHEASVARLWELRKRAWVYAGEYPEHLPLALRGLCMAHVANQMQRCGLPPMLWDAHAKRVDLDADLCNLVWAEMNLRTGNLSDAGKGDQTLVELFEHWMNRNGAALQEHLHALEKLAHSALYQ